ncbi:hypothetical protein [Paraliobacillus ryukyuensis]|uniref:hypothetical protein n=1 Tax=Paraliobacillus ryukyuensis TaxID=200904 RepID=UPI0009A7505B|nr:hypothetical protein [Paraliobacillus ryukyuensis]
MGEQNDSEPLQGQRILEKEKAIDCLDHYEENENDYYVIYQKQDQQVKRELKFNKVTKLSANSYAIAMHTEDETDHIRYYHGEEIILAKEEIIELRIFDPHAFDFVVYTD